MCLFWPRRTDTLDKFGVVNLQLRQLMEELRPLLKFYAVHPKARRLQTCRQSASACQSPCSSYLKRQHGSSHTTCGLMSCMPAPSGHVAAQGHYQFASQGASALASMQPADLQRGVRRRMHKPAPLNASRR